jgi:hypothetical protein
MTEFAIEMRGSGFLDAGVELSCKLTSTNATRTEYNANLVAYESTNSAFCIFDIIPQDVYDVGLSLNAYQYVQAEIPFIVLPAIELLDAEPASIMSRQIGQMIIV